MTVLTQCRPMLLLAAGLVPAVLACTGVRSLDADETCPLGSSWSEHAVLALSACYNANGSIAHPTHRVLRDGPGGIVIEDGYLDAQGERSGRWAHFDLDGSVIAKGEMLAGIPVGKWTVFGDREVDLGPTGQPQDPLVLDGGKLKRANDLFTTDRLDILYPDYNGALVLAEDEFARRDAEKKLKPEFERKLAAEMESVVRQGIIRLPVSVAGKYDFDNQRFRFAVEKAVWKATAKGDETPVFLLGSAQDGHPAALVQTSGLWSAVRESVGTGVRGRGQRGGHPVPQPCPARSSAV